MNKIIFGCADIIAINNNIVNTFTMPLTDLGSIILDIFMKAQKIVTLIQHYLSEKKTHTVQVIEYDKTPLRSLYVTEGEFQENEVVAHGLL